LRSFAKRWLADLDIDEMSREQLEMRFRSRILPELGALQIAAVTPSTIRTWDRGLREAGLSDRYRHTLFTNLSALFTAAQDDALIAKSPFSGKSVRKPRPARQKVVPWSEEWIWSVQEALPARFRVLVDLASGLGLRQGECFGLALEDVDFLRGVVTVRRQVKTVRYTRVYALPKYDKQREIPLPEPVKLALAAHLRAFPPDEIELPWDVATGPQTAHRLIVTSMRELAVAANDFNRNYWKVALEEAGVPHGRYENGMHELRHFFASTLLDQGESIKAVAEWLGHTDPAFTLATYTHLMPSSDQRTKSAIAGVYERRLGGAISDGPETAQKASGGA
jgi:integrase